MAYIDLVHLTTNPDFLGRIAYAVNKYALYIIHEAGDATDHVKRINWAIPANQNPQFAATQLVWRIIQEDSVINGMAAVEDSALQQATEVASNEFMLAPIGYVNYAATATNQDFLKRLAVAVVKYAAYILLESPTTANHQARYRWAQNAMMNSSGLATALANAVVLDTSVVENLMSSTDAQIQTAVEAQANILMM